MFSSVCVVVCAIQGAALAGAPPLIGPLAAPDALTLQLPGLPFEVQTRVHQALSRANVLGWVEQTARVARAQTAEVIERGPRAPLYDPPTEEERRLVETAVYHCDNAAARYAKPYVMLELLRTEEEFGIPPELRGVTLAAWCGEAAYQLENVVGDGGRAVGILQLHSDLTGFCGALDLRHDPIASAQCWLWNLRRVFDKAKRRCRAKDAWKAAELWLSQGGQKSNYACRKVSSHVARLEQWQRRLALEARVASNAAQR